MMNIRLSTINIQWTYDCLVFRMSRFDLVFWKTEKIFSIRFRFSFLVTQNWIETDLNRIELKNQVIKEYFASLVDMTVKVNSQTQYSMLILSASIYESGLASCFAWKNFFWPKNNATLVSRKQNWDEFCFVLFQSNRRAKVWHRVGEKYKVGCVVNKLCFGLFLLERLVHAEETMDSNVWVNILSNHFVSKKKLFAMMGLLEENGVIAIKEMFQEVRIMYSRAFFQAARQMTVLKRQFSLLPL